VLAPGAAFPVVAERGGSGISAERFSRCASVRSILSVPTGVFAEFTLEMLYEMTPTIRCKEKMERIIMLSCIGDAP
jgi:hypothetical protein